MLVGAWLPSTGARWLGQRVAAGTREPGAIAK
jgi:hypothetical protein